MKVLSIWQPFASLIIEGCKVFETRGWPAPASVIGTRIGIAATKSILSAQRSHCADEAFQAFYERTGLAEWTELPRGALLGTVRIDSVELMTEELIEDVSVEEQAYGLWMPGNYAWRLTDPVMLAEPIPLRGMQGLFEWRGALPDGHQEREGTRDQAIEGVPQEGEGTRQGRSQRSAGLRRHLRVVE